MQPDCGAPRNSDGDTLIEVIIATVIIGTILLGATTLSSRAFQAGISARERAQATNLLQTQAEALRALRDNNPWEDFRDLLPASGTDFHIASSGNRWQIVTSRLANPTINGTASIFSEVWVNGRLSGPDPTDPDKFEGTIHVTWPRLGSGPQEVTEMAFKLTDTELPLVGLTLNPPKPPEADFIGAPRSGTRNHSVNFTDRSTNNPDSWFWDFGDGGTSIAENPRHTYTRAGSFDVTLSVSGEGGSDSVTKRNYIRVNNPPEVCGNGRDDDGDGQINEGCPTRVTNCGGPWGIGVGQRLTCDLGQQRLVHHVYISAGCNDGERGRFELRFDDGTVRRYNAGCNTLINIPDEVTRRIRLRMLSGGGSDNFISWTCCGSRGWRAYWR